MHRVLVPLDGSGFSERAIPWADAYAAALNADVELLEVVDEDSEGALRTGPFGPETAALDRARSRFARPVRAMSVASARPAAEEIAARARTVGATLIVMASHGRGGLSRAVLGSVTSEVTSRSEVPVLVIPPNASTAAVAPTRVLVPLDMSTEGSSSVFTWLTEFVKELSWTIILGSIADLPHQTIPVQGAAIPVPGGPTHTPADVQSYLEGVAKDLQAQGLSAEVRVALGETAPAITQMAAESGAGVIAMVSRGRRGLERWTLGSVTEAVIREAAIPVLAFHPQ